MNEIANMFLITDGKNTVVSTTYPIPYGIFPAVFLFDATRRTLTAPFLIALESAVLLYTLYLILTSPEPTAFTAFSIGYPSLIIVLKFGLQRKVKMWTDRVRIVSVAPKIIWVEHLLLSLTLLCSASWALRMPGISHFAAHFFLIVALIGLLSFAWPFWVVSRFTEKAAGG